MPTTAAVDPVARQRRLAQHAGDLAQPTVRARRRRCRWATSARACRRAARPPPRPRRAWPATTIARQAPAVARRQRRPGGSRPRRSSAAPGGAVQRPVLPAATGGLLVGDRDARPRACPRPATRGRRAAWNRRELEALDAAEERLTSSTSAGQARRLGAARAARAGTRAWSARAACVELALGDDAGDPDVATSRSSRC